VDDAAAERVMKLFVVGVNYRTAPVEFREKVAIRNDQLFSTGWRLRHGAGLSELVILSTCNRVEIYGVAPDTLGDRARLIYLIAPMAEVPESYVYVHEGAAVIEHLIRVTSGLDSMVLGETDVQRQVKDWYDRAHSAGLTGKILNHVFQKALHAAKEIRTHTAIGVGTTSLGSVAVSLAGKIFGSRLQEVTVLLIGAGQMASTCLRHFVKSGVRSFLIANRSPERARGLTEEFGGRAVPIEELGSALIHADIVVSATGSSGFVVNRKDIEDVQQARRSRPLFLIDIAVPRDVDPDVRSVEGIFLYNVDDLEAVINGNLKNREAEIDVCAAIIADKVHTILTKLRSLEEFSHDDRIQSEPDGLFRRPATGGR
jgi:glutamyl-tRNA reductase